MFRARHLAALALLWLLWGATARAQYDPEFSHYFDMETTFNPAAAGKQSKLNVAAAYALTFAGFENNPRTMFAAADMPFMFLRGRHGAGAYFMNDQIGLFSHQRISLQYAYRHRLWGGTVAAGVQAGMIMESFDGTKLDLGDSGDPAFATTKVDGNGFDIGLGLYYEHGPWYAGLSVQHLNAPCVKLGETNELQIDPTYYLTGGCNIRLRNPFLTIKANTLVRTDAVAWRGDITARLEYRHETRILYGGVGYSPTNSVTLLFGGDFHGIRLGYSYEFYTSALSIGNGSHEIFLGYQMDINLGKKGRNRHQTTRTL